jgi:hypothetical protein
MSSWTEGGSRLAGPDLINDGRGVRPVGGTGPPAYCISDSHDWSRSELSIEPWSRRELSIEP